MHRIGGKKRPPPGDGHVKLQMMKKSRLQHQWNLASQVEAEQHPFFVGRQNELNTIRQNIEHGAGSIIVGRRGSGKTALLRMHQLGGGSEYPGGIAYIQCQALFNPIVEEIRLKITVPVKGRAMVFADDVHALAKDQLEELQHFLDINPQVHFVATADESFRYQFTNAKDIHLGGLSQNDYYAILNAHIKAANLDPKTAKLLWESTTGSPLFANVANRTIRDHLLTWRQLLESLQGFEYSGILDPAGRPLPPAASLSPKLIVSVENTNHNILEQLRRDPRKFWELSPRKFEEIVAELLTGLGYEVQLTPFSGDGGFDMYAAKSDAIGRFLFLVECKRYVPPGKVGIQVIRSLHGVVQQKNANAGIVATTSFFTKGAKEFQSTLKHQLHLNDYFALQSWLKGQG